MITFNVDYGTWEEGRVYAVEANSCDEALNKARQKAEADEERNWEDHEGPVQVCDEQGNLHWDLWSGSYDIDATSSTEPDT